LIAAIRRPALPRVPAGLPGTGPVRLLDVNSEATNRPMRPSSRRRPARRASRHPAKQWLAVADAPLSRYGEGSINRRLPDLDWVSRVALAHESVIESFTGAQAVLPMKLFTIFTSDARALEHLRRERARIRRLLDRVTGHQEWGVRIALDGGISPAGKHLLRSRATSTASGVAYLSLKKAQHDRASGLVQRARATAAALYDRLQAHAAASKRRAPSGRPVTGGPLLLDASFLVPRSRSARFRALVGRESTALASEGYLVTMSGPWPPYTFVQD
jgi:Gas vesicle synthesis protein GvpL/GvpF